MSLKIGDTVRRQNGDDDAIGEIKQFSPNGQGYALVAWKTDAGRVYHRVTPTNRLRKVEDFTSESN